MQALIGTVVCTASRKFPFNPYVASFKNICGLSCNPGMSWWDFLPPIHSALSSTDITVSGACAQPCESLLRSAHDSPASFCITLFSVLRNKHPHFPWRIFLP